MDFARWSLILLFCFSLPAHAAVEEFDTSPSGWDAVRNTAGNQDFGFSNTNDCGRGAGEAGGSIFRDTVGPAYYALPIGPITDLDQPLSFSVYYRRLGGGGSFNVDWPVDLESCLPFCRAQSLALVENCRQGRLGARDEFGNGNSIRFTLLSSDDGDGVFDVIGWDEPPQHSGCVRKISRRPGKERSDSRSLGDSLLSNDSPFPKWTEHFVVSTVASRAMERNSFSPEFQRPRVLGSPFFGVGP